MLKNIIGTLAIVVFLIGIIITKVTGSSKTGAEFVTASFSVLAKPLMWPVERQFHKLERLDTQTGSSTGK